MLVLVRVLLTALPSLSLSWIFIVPPTLALWKVTVLPFFPHSLNVLGDSRKPMPHLPCRELTFSLSPWCISQVGILVVKNSILGEACLAYSCNENKSFLEDPCQLCEFVFPAQTLRIDGSDVDLLLSAKSS